MAVAGVPVVLSPGEQALQEQFSSAIGANKIYQFGFSTSTADPDFTGYFRGTEADLNLFQTAYHDQRSWAQFTLNVLAEVGHPTTLIQRGLPDSSYTDRKTYNLAMQKLSEPGAYLLAATPNGEHVELAYDKKGKTYHSIHGLGTSEKDVNASDALLMTKQAVFEKALGRYKDAILNFRRGLTDEPTLKNAFANYEVARRNFKSAIDARGDGQTETNYLGEARTFLLLNSPEQLYVSLAPEKTFIPDESHHIQQSRQTAQAKWTDYQNIKRYLGPSGEGRFATDDAKSTLLYTAVGAVQAAFTEDKTRYSRDIMTSLDYTNHFPADHGAYFAPRPDAEFYDLLIPYLKDPKITEAPEFLMKRMSPEQKELTEALFDVKKWGYLKADVKMLLTKLPKTISRAICIGVVSLGGAFTAIHDKFVTRVKSDVALARDLSGAFEAQARIGEAEWTPATTVARPVAAFASAAFQAMLEDPLLGSNLAPQGAVRLEKEIEDILDKSSFKTALTHMQDAQDDVAFDAIFNRVCDRDTKSPAAYIDELYEKLQELGELNYKHPRDPTLLVSALRKPYRTIKWTYDNVQKVINERLAPVLWKKAALLSTKLDNLQKLAALGNAPEGAVIALRGSLQTLLDTLPVLRIDTIADQDYPEMGEIGLLFKKAGINQLRATLTNLIAFADRLNIAAPITTDIKAYFDQARALVGPALTLAEQAELSIRAYDRADELQNRAIRLATATVEANEQFQGHVTSIRQNYKAIRDPIERGDFDNDRLGTIRQGALDSLTAARTASEQVRLNAEATARTVQAVADAALHNDDEFITPPPSPL